MRHKNLFAVAVIAFISPAVMYDALSDPLAGAESPRLPGAAPAGPVVEPPLPQQPQPLRAGPLITPGETAGAVPDSTARTAASTVVDTSTSAPGGQAESPANGTLPSAGPESPVSQPAPRANTPSP
jgi:hypothetical protein